MRMLTPNARCNCSIKKRQATWRFSMCLPFSYSFTDGGASVWHVAPKRHIDTASASRFFVIFRKAYSSFSRSSKAAFTTTNTEPQLCHNAPVTGLRMPSAANMTAVRLMIRDAMMLICTFFITFCMRLNRYGSRLISSLTSTASALGGQGTVLCLDRQCTIVYA